MKNKSAVALGRKSAEKRGIHQMTKEQRSKYMSLVRQKKNPLLEEYPHIDMERST